MKVFVGLLRMWDKKNIRKKDVWWKVFEFMMIQDKSMQYI